MKSRYIVVKSTYYHGSLSRTSYGIALAEIGEDTIAIIRSIPDISPEKEKLCQLVERFNTYDLDPVHLMDALMDFIGII